MATSKQQFNRKKFTKEYKVREIQKSLTKKARLTKEYLKALKEEGYTVPDKKPSNEGSYDYKKRKEERNQENKRRLEEKRAFKRDKLQKQKENFENRKQNEADSIKAVKEKYVARDDRKRKMTQRTRSGQPKMGPKIEDLLNKIKGDETYTR